jgi:CubicO group peptidase (beta-lactamase class C family)
MKAVRCFWCGVMLCLVAKAGAGECPAEVFPRAQWREATPQSQGLDEDALRSALEYLRANSGGAGSDEMVVVRNGYLVWKGPDADSCHEIYSCTKTFTSTALGLLVKDGVVGLDDPATKYHPSLDDRYPEYAKIRIRHLATMTSGYDNVTGSGWDFYKTDRARHHEHVLSYTTPGPPLFVSGTSFKYHDPAIHMLG